MLDPPRAVEHEPNLAGPTPARPAPQVLRDVLTMLAQPPSRGSGGGGGGLARGVAGGRGGRGFPLALVALASVSLSCFFVGALARRQSLRRTFPGYSGDESSACVDVVLQWSRHQEDQNVLRDVSRSVMLIVGAAVVTPRKGGHHGQSRSEELTEEGGASRSPGIAPLK